mgnify:CR=1 FL=1
MLKDLSQNLQDLITAIEKPDKSNSCKLCKFYINCITDYGPCEFYEKTDTE